ncbi:MULTISPECIES: universal stress protein [Halorussus]|uniref:universal stress protein n=1 Tax=Halorussus TaxID=1070314 RepID=UPI00209F5D19|nr:universal stress protein [Halorussus vallis]USZ76740.1 universal stress protein [Halorussus vallis]
MYDRILVPTDGSAETERAVAHAADLATAHDAELHAVYVVDAATFAGLPMEASWDGITETLHGEGEAALERVESIADDRGVAVTTHLLEGSPSKRIVQWAEGEDCDLVVMGTHGRGGIDRLLLGSVAERVVRACKVPVLTVRVGDDEETPTASEASAETESAVVE